MSQLFLFQILCVRAACLPLSPSSQSGLMNRERPRRPMAPLRPLTCALCPSRLQSCHFIPPPWFWKSGVEEAEVDVLSAVRPEVKR